MAASCGCSILSTRPRTSAAAARFRPSASARLSAAVGAMAEASRSDMRRTASISASISPNVISEADGAPPCPSAFHRG